MALKNLRIQFFNLSQVEMQCSNSQLLWLNIQFARDYYNWTFSLWENRITLSMTCRLKKKHFQHKFLHALQMFLLYWYLKVPSTGSLFEICWSSADVPRKTTLMKISRQELLGKLDLCMNAIYFRIHKTVGKSFLSKTNEPSSKCDNFVWSSILKRLDTSMFIDKCSNPLAEHLTKHNQNVPQLPRSIISFNSSWTLINVIAKLCFCSVKQCNCVLAV